MSQAIIRFGELKVESFVQGVNNNWLIYSELPFSKQHSSGLDGDILIGATPTVEIIDADLDVAVDPQYAYAYSISTDNKLKIAFNKTKHPDKGSALEALKCISITYELGHLTPNGGLYIAIFRNSLGEEIHRTTPISLTQCNTVISTFNDTRQIDTGGYLRCEVIPDFVVS
ncbi:hypothetical protein SAMN04487895_10365 [Paenibacillus sophorae]|uniref:Uncharacterized protein n=1 Tax=Paenibacillus sophorae TaxID=1333845 RepID=A0A1H8JM54_9BACL|nr:hypothetical protein [Paenibacillus sophorae]QWU13399.1 hypothetical protein KP014_15470 [Paenibacillus sophorae]SEN81387.1 hypothetical protein SAMN04487895_10365 [Paenibacillus sophorae]